MLFARPSSEYVMLVWVGDFDISCHCAVLFKIYYLCFLSSCNLVLDLFLCTSPPLSSPMQGFATTNGSIGHWVAFWQTGSSYNNSTKQKGLILPSWEESNSIDILL